MQPRRAAPALPLHQPAGVEVSSVVGALLAREASPTPSHLYLELLRHGLRNGWDLGRLDLRQVVQVVASEGFTINPKSGRLTRSSPQTSSQP